MSNAEINNELQDIEATLRQLRPQSANVNRDAIVYCAGEQTMRRRLYRWQAASAFLATVLVGVSVWGINQPQPSPEIRTVKVPQPKPAPAPPVAPKPKLQPPRDQVRPSEPAPRNFASRDIAYYRLQRHLLRWGFDGLPAPPTPPAMAFDQTTLANLRRQQPAPDEEFTFFSSWLKSFDKE